MMEGLNNDYNKEMDCCLRASSILYARLFELGERIHLADTRYEAELSADREISRL